MVNICLKKISVQLILALQFLSLSAQEILQTVEGTIGAENYTYRSVSRKGRLLIELISLEGDADIYVSSDSRPTFDNYEIQSISCGTDIVEIPESFPRPFWVGIYGHFTAETTRYKINVYLLDKLEEMDYDELTHYYYDYEAADHTFYNYDASDYMFRDVKPANFKYSAENKRSDGPEGTLDDTDDESAGSVIWQILLTILKVIFEVIV